MIDCSLHDFPVYNSSKYALEKRKADMSRAYLESYRVYSKMLDMRTYEEKLASKESVPGDKQASIAYEIVCIKTRMREIENFIENLKVDSNWFECKLFLKYHYVLGHTVEECSELIHVSRSTAYRLKKRALKFAAEQFSA